MMKNDFTDKELAMLIGGLIAIFSIMFWGIQAKDLVFFIAGGIFALAGDRARRTLKGGV